MTFQWGCGNYSGFGDGGAYDGDAIGDNYGVVAFVDPAEALADRHVCTTHPKSC